MEQVTEKDNFWVYVGGLIAGVLILVVVFKGMHGEAIPAAYQETAKEVDQQIQKAKQN